MAVSSWNDNGQKQFVHDPGELSSIFLVYRSDNESKLNAAFIFKQLD